MNLPVFSLLALVLIFPPHEAAEMVEGNHVKSIIGAIVDDSSRIGKEQRVAMEMAAHDFNEYGNQTHDLVDLQIRNYWREPVHAAVAGNIPTVHTEIV